MVVVEKLRVTLKMLFQILSIVLLLTISEVVCAQSGKLSATEYDLKGKVKWIETLHYLPDYTTSIKDSLILRSSRIVVFRKNGKVQSEMECERTAESKSGDDYNTSFHCTNIWNDDLLVKKIQIFPSSRKEVIEYQYNSNGQVVRVHTYDSSNADIKGKLKPVVTVVYRWDDKLLSEHTYIDERFYYKLIRERHTYDQKNRKSMTRYTSFKHTRLLDTSDYDYSFNEKFEYDDSGRLKSEFRDGISPQSSYYEYDSIGRMVKAIKAEYHEGGHHSSYSEFIISHYSYNEYGDLVRQIDSFQIDGRKRELRSIHTMLHEYDLNNNRIKTAFYDSDGLVKIEARRIEYY